MGDRADEGTIHAALTELVMNCPELKQLEARLSQFNILRVLRADRDEMRHSNLLAWLLAPDEAHGLGDSFLRRWLMRVLHNADNYRRRPPGWISPLAVDALDVEHVEIHRELENIDLLIVIHRAKGKHWIVCIENKLESLQHSNQLARYHEIIERRFAAAERRIYIFLTKHDESPTHDAFIPSSYEEIIQALDECLDERGDAIGPEPLLLLRHYRQLLAEDFMDQSEASKLARQIYLRHKRALDFILENKVDPIYEASNALEAALKRQAAALGIVVDRTVKGYVRFLPKEWDVPENSGGTGWGPNSRYLLCEVCLWTKKAELQITAGKAPDAWADLVWQRAAHAPFRQEWKVRPEKYVKPYKSRSDITVERLADLDEEEMANRLVDWLKDELAKDKFKEAVRVLADLLPRLRDQ